MTKEEMLEMLGKNHPIAVATQGDIRTYMKRVLDSKNYRYRGGAALALPEFIESTYAEDARKDATESLQGAAKQWVGARAETATKGATGAYAAYARQESEKAYRAAVTDAAGKLAAAYPDYYEDLPESMRATQATRIKLLSFMAVNDLDDEECLVYALGAGLNYDEALELSTAAAKMRQLLGEDFVYYKYMTGGSEDE